MAFFLLCYACVVVDFFPFGLIMLSWQDANCLVAKAAYFMGKYETGVLSSS